jgi:peptidoglycan L-alanyl-D-glutamate endopeptidase CwlK
VSAPLTQAEILHWQRLYRCAGFYAGKLDGIWGPRTERASRDWEAAYSAARSRYGQLDGRTERLLYGVVPRLQELVRELLERLDAAGIDARVISGTRSYAEQDALYRQGRDGRPGPRVTNARPGQSLHNFGLAVDLGVFQGGRYLSESPLYDRAGEISVGVKGLEWGGSWRSLKDRPHYQLATGLAISELRRRFETGELELQVA